MKLRMLALLLMLPGIVRATECPIDVSFDRFNRATSYNTPMELTAGQRTSVVFHSVQVGNEVNSRLVIGRAGSNFRYDNCPIVHVIVDGNRINLGFKYTVTVMDNNVIVELFSADLSLDQFSKLASAQKVEYRICNDEFEIPSSVLCTGRDIYQRIK